MRVITFLFLVFILSSCGLREMKHIKRSSASRQFSKTDPIFSSYVTSFEKEAEAYHGSNFNVGDIPINFGDTGNPTYQGVCILYSNGQKEIIISKEWWDSNSVSDRELMIYHELGHCRLGREHNNEYIVHNHDEKFKLSIMNEVLPQGHYKTLKEGYIAELFNHSKKQMEEKVYALLNISEESDHNHDHESSKGVSH